MKRKSLYPKEYIFSYDEEDYSDDNLGKFPFMALEDTANDHGKDYVDGKVDIEEELISALSELKKEMKKNKLLKKELGELKESSRETLKRQRRYLYI